MFETIGTLFAIGFWVFAIFLFLCGIIFCIANLITGSGWQKFMAGIAVTLGIITFFYTYNWSGSIAWCLLTTGLVLGFVSGAFSGTNEKAPPKEKKYGFTDAYLDTYCEYQLTKQAVKDAIRESKD